MKKLEAIAVPRGDYGHHERTAGRSGRCDRFRHSGIIGLGIPFAKDDVAEIAGDAMRRSVLRGNGLRPAPRRASVTWRALLRAQASSIIRLGGLIREYYQAAA